MSYRSDYRWWTQDFWKQVRLYGNLAAIHFMHDLRNRRGGGGNCPPPPGILPPPPPKKINSLKISIYKSEYSNMAK